MRPTINIVGDWKAKVKIPLQDALRVSMDLMGRDGLEACRHFVILSARSAGAVTPKGKARRPVESGASRPGSEFVRFHSQRRAPWKLHLPPKANKTAKAYAKILGTKTSYATRRNQLTKIGRAGLAKRSWSWGLRGLNASGGDMKDAIPGVVTSGPVQEGGMRGYKLDTRVKYLLKILPAGWAEHVEQKAVNSVMKRAVSKMQSDVGRAITRAARAT